MTCAYCGANYASSGKNGKDYYTCGSHIYRRGAGCEKPSWGIPRQTLEELVLNQIVRRAAADDAVLEASMDMINQQIRDEWDVFVRTEHERAKAIEHLRSRLNAYYDVAATIGVTEDIRSRIAEANQALSHLETLNNAREPDKVDIEEVKAAVSEIRTLAQSNDPDAAQSILEQFVVQLKADSKKRVVEGILLDPRSSGASFVAAPTGVEPVFRP